MKTEKTWNDGTMVSPKARWIVALILLFGGCHSNAQGIMEDPKQQLKKYYMRDTMLIRNWYSMTASEIIFSGGEVKTGGKTLDNVPRFTVFFHFQKQYHYNFSNALGIYTGFGVRNVGFINRLPINDSMGEA